MTPDESQLSKKSRRKRKTKILNTRIIVLIFITLIFAPAAILIFGSGNDTNQGIDWLFRDSAFFILIISLVGFLILFSFNQHQQYTQRQIDELREKIHNLEIKQAKDIQDTSAILEKVLAWADRINGGKN